MHLVKMSCSSIKSISVMIMWLLFVSTACNEMIEPHSVSDDQRYFPLAVGNEWIYAQTKIEYEITGFDTLNSEVKESVVAVDSSVLGTLRFTLQRSSRTLNNTEWEIDTVYSIKQSADWLLTQIGNVVNTTLNFPVEEGRQWNYSSHSTANDHYVSYQNDSLELYDQPVFTGLFDSNESIMVIISDIPRIISNQDQQYEVYLKEVGMIEKKSVIFDFCTSNCDSTYQINSGTFLHKRLISYDVN